MFTNPSESIPSTFHEFMINLLEENKDKKIPKSILFKNGAEIWKNQKTSNEKIQTESNSIKLKLTSKNKTKLWICNITNNEVVINSGESTKLKEEKKIFNDKEQCDCFIEKKVLLMKKKGFVEF